MTIDLSKAKVGDKLFHIEEKCGHDFKGWREFADKSGGERVCTKCGMGAMHWSMVNGI